MKRLDRRREKVNFGFETSKGYMAAVIVLFHIVPLFAAVTNQADALITVLLTIINPMVVFFISGAFGVKEGFTWKLSLFTSVIFMPSVIMYYIDIKTPDDVMNAIQTMLIFAIVYFIFSVIATGIGSLIKKWLF